jgi:hypothetical protein
MSKRPRVLKYEIIEGKISAGRGESLERTRHGERWGGLGLSQAPEARRPSRSTVHSEIRLPRSPSPNKLAPPKQIPHHAPSARSASLPSACRLCRRRHPGLWGKTRKNPARHRCRKGPLKPTSALSSGAHSPAFQDRRQPLPEAEPGPRPACLANHRACF